MSFHFRLSFHEVGNMSVIQARALAEYLPWLMGLEPESEPDIPTFESSRREGVLLDDLYRIVRERMELEATGIK